MKKDPRSRRILNVTCPAGSGAAIRHAGKNVTIPSKANTSSLMWQGRSIPLIVAMPSMHALILLLAVFLASQGWAAGTTVRDGGTLQLADVTYRLDGIEGAGLGPVGIDEPAGGWGG